MENNKKYVRKSFWVHQYEKEEVFLSKMAADGWQFLSLHKGLPTTYEFIKGDKFDYIYQLDFVGTIEDTAAYHQLFVDAGWEEVYNWPGLGGVWYYFRRIHTAGIDERVYTDTESKYHMYEKLWKKFGLIFLLAMFMEMNGVYSVSRVIEHLGSFSVLISVILIALCCLFALVAIMCAYLGIALFIAKNRIQSRLKQHL